MAGFARLLIVGAGAVGATFGAMLARAGERVTFLARGETLAVLRARGLRIERPGGTSFALPAVDAIASPEGAGPFDLVLVCVKVPDTAAAVRGLRGALSADAVVLSLQNGVESEEWLEGALGLSPMLRAVAFVGAEVVEPGVIRHVSGGTIVVGEPEGGRSSRLERLLALLSGAGIGAEVSADVHRSKWQKLAWNASFNVIAALTGRRVGEILADPAGRRLVETVMREVEAVAAARGIAFERDYVYRVIRYTERNLGGVRPSTLQDRERGRPLEHEALTGAVVRFGARLDVPTPACRALDALAALVIGQRSRNQV